MTIKVKVNTTLADKDIAGTQMTHSMCRGPNGTIWVLYIDGNRYLYVAYSSDGGVTWTEELVGDIAASLDEGHQAIMVDSANVPHIICRKRVGATQTILYLSRSGGSWNAPESVLVEPGIYYLDACIDSGDTFHIAWTASGSDVYYLTGTSGSWGARETISNAGRNGVSITVNSSDEPYVCYTKSSVPRTMMFAYKTGGAWQAAVQASTVSGWYPSICTDSNDDIHIVFLMQVGVIDHIYYRKRTSGVWGTEIDVATEKDAVGFSAPILTLDSSDNAYIIYAGDWNATDETVWYRKITSGVLGGEQVLDDDILQPDGYSSTYSGLWHRYPSSGVLAASLHPVVVLLQESNSDADVYFEASRISAFKPWAALIT